MKQLLSAAGLAALALGVPALAHGNGHGGGHGNHHGYGQQYGYNGPTGHGVGGCPRGLARKHNGCMPPGQAKKLYRIGQRLPYGYNRYTTYGRIPYDLRNRYDLDPSGRYIYNGGYLYEVDPRTRVISQILSAILR